eukprot:1144824-Pelagomonas_calceolata.AAC.1
MKNSKENQALPAKNLYTLLGSQAGSQKTPKKHGQPSSSALSNLTHKDEPYLSIPAADLALDNLERQGFDKEDGSNRNYRDRKLQILVTEVDLVPKPNNAKDPQPCACIYNTHGKCV